MVLLYIYEWRWEILYEERKSNCSERISTALAIRNMKQSELCERTKIPKSAISQYISGAFEPKQDRIYLIARELDVSEAWLMGYDVPMERNKKTSPNEPQLTEGEKMLLDLFNRVPKDKQQIVLQMIRAALETQE